MATTKKRYSLIAYTDSCPDIDNAIKSFGEIVVRYAYILHDLDVEPNGDIKKPHYHLFIEFEKDVSSNTIESRFGTKVHQSVKSMEGCIIYMTHKRDISKTQYDYKCIKYMNVDVENIVLNCTGAENSEMEVLIHILAHIKACRPNMQELIEWVLNYGYYFVFRSNFSVIKEYMKL